jgi:transposase
VLSEDQSIPLAVAVSGATVHDRQAFKPLLQGIPSVRQGISSVRSWRGQRRGRPAKVRADKAHFSAQHLAWLRSRGLIPRIARPGIESGERLRRHRWKIERSIARLLGYRRLTVRCEHQGGYFLAFLGLAAAFTCDKKFAKLTTQDTLLNALDHEAFPYAPHQTQSASPATSTACDEVEKRCVLSTTLP